MTHATESLNVRTGTFLSWSPILRSILLAVVSSIVIVGISSGEEFNTNNIYSGVFDLLAIFTGFLGTFYVFVVTKGNVFLERVKATPTYSMVLRLLKFTILWSVFMIGYSYFLMVLDPKDFQLYSISNAIVLFWLMNVYLIAVNFTRCIYHFMIIVEAGK